MAASYPGGFDTMSDPSANLSGPPLHSTMHNQINDVIEAIEAELGLNPSGADATVAATLAALSSRYVALTGGVLLGSTMAAVVTATITPVTWDNEVSDPDGWHAGAVAAVIVPAGKAGRYAVTYNGIWSGGAPGAGTGVACKINAVGTYEQVAGAAPPFTYWTPTISFIRTFAALDTINFEVYQNAGANRALVSRLEIAPV